MDFSYMPFLEIFLGILGFGFSIMFCVTFCRACSRIRETQVEREAWRINQQGGPPRSIYVIPFPRNVDNEDPLRVPQHSQDPQTPPRYSTTVYPEAPPSYNELGFKPEDLPPAYTEYNVPVYPITPPPNEDTVQPETQSQP